MARSRLSTPLRVGARLLVCLILGAAPGRAVSFTLLEAPSGDTTTAFALSADGSTVVGSQRVNDLGDTFPFSRYDRPIVWRDGAPGVFLPDGFGLSSAGSIAVDADGSRIAATGCFDLPCTRFPPQADPTRGSYLFEDGRYDRFSPSVPTGASPSSVRGISNDGRVIVTSRGLLGSTRYVDGVASELEIPPVALSGDGRVSIGGFRTPALAIEAQAMSLALPDGAQIGGPLDVSFDGRVIVGSFVSTRANEDGLLPIAGFRWEDGVAISLGDDAAVAVSADGSTILGKTSIWFGLSRRVLEDFLLGLGLDIAGWSELAGIDVSDDGRTVLGSGRNPHGELQNWVAVIPEPGSDALLALGLLLLGHRRRA